MIANRRARLVAVACFVLATVLSAPGASPDELARPASVDRPNGRRVLLVANASVDARFVANPSEPQRDLMTGDTRADLERDALAYFAALLRDDPDRFERLERRILGDRGAETLHARGLAAFTAGHSATAEMAWQHVVAEHPDSPQAGPALLHIAGSRLRDGDRTAASDALAGLATLDLESSAEAAPLIARLLDETEADLARRGELRGDARVRLDQSLQRLGLDRTREMLEWTSGNVLLDDVASTLRLETSGDVLRRLKNLGVDSLRLNALVKLIDQQERIDGVHDEELLRDGTDPEAAAARAHRRTEGRQLDRLENLARLQQLQVALLARALESLVLEDDARRLGDRTLNHRRELVGRLEHLGRRASLKNDQRTWEERAVTELVRLADVNDDGRVSPLHDDEGFWRPKRLAVEADMKSAQFKALDDDNKRPIADLFERTGLSEKGLLHALVRATVDRRPVATTASDAATGPRVDHERTRLLLERLRERGAPAWHAAHPRRSPRPGDIELDYIARLNVLRRPGEGLDDVLRREVLGDGTSPDAGAGPTDLAGDPRSAPLVAELASLGSRWHGAWLFEDDPAGAPRARTAEQKFARATEIWNVIDDAAAARALDLMATSIVADLESQGLRFDAGDLALIRQRVQHEDLGTLAFVFDELGDFSHLDEALGWTTTGTKLGEWGPGHVAFGFGLDLDDSPAPAAHVGWRGTHETKSGRAVVRYHVGAAGAPIGATDASGVTARFRRREVWQPEVGADVSVVRGLMGRGFIGFIRDVTVKHERKLAAVFADHERARAEGRPAFLESVLADDADARPAALFMESLGRTAADYDHDEESFLTLLDSYEFEKARQRSMLNRKAWKVRFAGVGVSVGFFGGDVFLLAGPMLAFKDFRLFSQFVDGADRRVQSEEAERRRRPVLGAPTPDRAGTRAITQRLDQDRDVEGRAQFQREVEDNRVTSIDLRDDAMDADRAARWELASREPILERLGPGEPAWTEDGARRSDDRSLQRLDAALRRRNVPLAIRPTEVPTAHELSPRDLMPWSSQSIELYVDDVSGLGLTIGNSGLPVLISPMSLDGVVIDCMEEVRSVTRRGDADEIYRVVFSRLPGRAAAEVMEASASYLRVEVVDGETIGTTRIHTMLRGPDDILFSQANLVSPQDPDATERIASLLSEAAGVRRAALPELPPLHLIHPARPADGTVNDPALLDRAFLDELRRTGDSDVGAFKRRSMSWAAEPSGPAGDFDPRNVAFLQARSLAENGRPLSGAALEHSHFVMTHEGLYRADGGPVARQVQHLAKRAITPFGPGRELDGAADERTRRLLQLAGVDSRKALDDMQGSVRALVEQARATGVLRRDVLPAGTRIVTASQVGKQRGVQRTTAREPLEAHLIEPLSLHSNEGRHVTGLALGADLPALAEALTDALANRSGRRVEPIDIDDELLPALAGALAAPHDERTLRAHVRGNTVTIELANAPRAGALARCKNATLFPPAYGARVESEWDYLLASGPVTMVGVAEADTRFVGQSWAGWRRLTLLFGGPWDDDDPLRPIEDEERQRPPGGETRDRPHPPDDGRRPPG